MTGKRCAGNDDEESPSSAKRLKDVANWRPGDPARSVSTLYSANNPPDDDERLTHKEQGKSGRAKGSKPAPPRSGSYFDLACEALTAHPNGLRSDGIVEWLRVQRPVDFAYYGEAKLKTSISSTLSMQSNKKRPEVWKYRDDTVKGAGYIWKLADIPRFYRTKEDLHLSNNALGQISSDAAATHRTAWASMATLGGQMEPGHAESTVASSRSSGELNTHESRPTPQPATALCSNDGTRPLISDQATSEAAPDLQEIHQRSPHEAHPARTPGSNHDQPLSAAIDGETEVITTIEESQKPTKDCNAEVIMQSEDRLHYGKLVLQLRQWKERRSQLTEEIAGAQILLGDIDVLQDHVVQASEELLELERQVEQAQNRVESARKDLEAAKNRAEYVTAAKREVERIDKTSLEVREQLGID